MTATAFTKPEAILKRDRYGRPMVKDPDTGKMVPYRRVTTFIDVLDDRYNLELWKQRQVAHGLALRNDLVLKAASANGDNKILNEVCTAAVEAAGSSAASTTGTALHALTEQLDRGEDPLIPPSAQGDIDAYRKATEHLTMRHIEVFVVHDELRVGGTFDRVVEVDGVAHVADIKTGRIDYGASKIAMQLALYANSSLYDIAIGARRALDVDTTRGLVVHLPAGAGEASLHWADLAQGWEGVKVANQVWQWRSRQGLLDASDPVPAPDLLGLINIAGDRQSLENLYRDYQHLWTESLTDAVKTRLIQLSSPSA